MSKLHECCRCGGHLGEMLEDGWLPCYHCGATGKCDCHHPDKFFVTITDQEGNIVGKTEHAGGLRANQIVAHARDLAKGVQEASIIKKGILQDLPDIDHREATFRAIAKVLVMKDPRDFNQIIRYLQIVSDYQLSYSDARDMALDALPKKDRLFHDEPDQIPF